MKRFKKLLFLILVFPVLLIASECTTFTDIEGSQYKSDILYASDTAREWVSCKTEFEPLRNTTRREAIAMAIDAGGHTPPDTTSECFDDIQDETWSRNYICYAKSQGIIASNTSFRPADDVSFQEASKMILRSITTINYNEINDPTNWGDAYLEKMSYYGFKNNSSDRVNRDYFTHILRAIEADPNKQPTVSEPRIDSASLSSHNITQGDEVTLNIRLTNPLISGFSINTQSLQTSIGTLNCNGTSCSAKFIANMEGARFLIVFINQNGQTIDTARVEYDVADKPIVIPTPTVSSLIPRTATFNENTTFTVNGTNLPSTLKLHILECENMLALGGTDTSRTFSCTPSHTIGSKDVVVKDNEDGITLHTSAINVIELDSTVSSIIFTNILPKVSPKNIDHTFDITLSKKLNAGQVVKYEYEGLTRGNFLVPTQPIFNCIDVLCTNQTDIIYAGVDRAIRFAIFEGTIQVTPWKIDTYTVSEPKVIRINIEPTIAKQGTSFDFKATLSESLPKEHYLKVQLEAGEDDVYNPIKPVICDNISCTYSQVVNTAKYNRKVRFGIFYDDELTPIGWEYATYDVEADPLVNKEPIHINKSSYVNREGNTLIPLSKNFKFYTQWSDEENNFIVDVRIRYRKVGSSTWSDEIVLDYYKNGIFTNNKIDLNIGSIGQFEFETKASDVVELNTKAIHTTPWISAGTFEVSNSIKPTLIVVSDRVVYTKHNQAITIKLKAIDDDNDIAQVDIDWYGNGKKVISIDDLESEEIFESSFTYQSRYGYWETLSATAYDKAGNTSNMINIKIWVAGWDKRKTINTQTNNPKSIDGTANCEIDKYGAVGLVSGAEKFNLSFLNQKGLNALSFNLSYNSILLSKGTISNGWSTNYSFNAKLETTIDDDMIVHWTDQQYNLFEKETNTTFKSNDKITQFDSLIRNDDKSYTLTKKNRVVYEFDEYGVLESIENHKGNKLGFVFDVNSSLSRIVDVASGLFIEYHYENNKLVKVSDSIDREVTFTYSDDNASNLIKIEAPENISYDFEYNEIGQITKYTYGDGTVYFENVYLENGLVASEDDGIDSNEIVHYTFDHNSTKGKIFSQYNDKIGGITKYEYNASNYSLFSVIDKLNNKTTNTYNEQGLLSSMTNAKNQTLTLEYNDNGDVTKKTSPDASYETLAYDEHKNLISHSLLSADGSQKFTTTYEYDTNHNLIKKTAPNGDSSTFTYNEENLLLTQTSPKGNSVTYAYDEYKRVERITYPNSESISYVYDKIGRVLKQIDQLGNEVKFVYDNADRVIEIVNALGNSAKFTYDQRANRLTATDAQGNVASFTYDANNNLLTQTNALGAVSSFEYDGEDRVIKVTDANSNSVSFEYDAMGRVVKSIDAMENSSSVEYDALGNVKKSYDAMGNLVAELFYDNTNNLIKAVDSLNQSTQTSYNLMGQPETITDAKNRVSKFNYDQVGRLVEAIDTMNGKSTQSYDKDGNRVDFSDPKENKTSYIYNNLGLPTSLTTASGSTTSFAYNAKNQLSQSSNARGQSSDIFYNDDGSIASIKDEVGTIEYSYDKNGNVLTISENGKTISMSYSVLNQLLTYNDGEENTIAYTYDKVGNLVTLTYPNATIVSYAYNANNQLISVTNNNKTTAYEYDKNSRIIKITRPNGTILTRSYNEANQLLSQKDMTPSGVVIAEFSFAYDEVGNIIEETNSNEISPKVLANVEMSYLAGNLLGEANNTKAIFDADDNMLELGSLKLSYDSRNRLLSANGVEYSYNMLNNKIAMSKNGATTKYIVNPNAPLSQLLILNDTQSTTYTYGLGLISQTKESQTLYYHYDLRGSTIALTNENGEIVDRFSYLPYGELYKHSLGTTSTPFLYNGRDGVMNEENNLYYMRARFYSTDVKRFVNRDVLIGGIADFGSLNQFGYVNGRPIIGIDPKGKWINFVVGAVASVATGYVIAKVTGSEYSWKDAGVDAVMGATGAGLASKLSKLNKIRKLKKFAKKEGMSLQPNSSKGMSIYKNSNNTLKIKTKPAKNAIGISSKQSRYSLQVGKGVGSGYKNLFTGITIRGAKYAPFRHLPLSGIGIGASIGIGATIGAFNYARGTNIITNCD